MYSIFRSFLARACATLCLIALLFPSFASAELGGNAGNYGGGGGWGGSGGSSSGYGGGEGGSHSGNASGYGGSGSSGYGGGEGGSHSGNASGYGGNGSSDGASGGGSSSGWGGGEGGNSTPESYGGSVDGSSGGGLGGNYSSGYGAGDYSYSESVDAVNGGIDFSSSLGGNVSRGGDSISVTNDSESVAQAIADIASSVGAYATPGLVGVDMSNPNIGVTGPTIGQTENTPSFGFDLSNPGSPTFSGDGLLGSGFAGPDSNADDVDDNNGLPSNPGELGGLNYGNPEIGTPIGPYATTISIDNKVVGVLSIPTPGYFSTPIEYNENLSQKMATDINNNPMGIEVVTVGIPWGTEQYVTIDPVTQARTYNSPFSRSSVPYSQAELEFAAQLAEREAGSIMDENGVTKTAALAQVLDTIAARTLAQGYPNSLMGVMNQKNAYTPVEDGLMTNNYTSTTFEFTKALAEAVFNGIAPPVAVDANGTAHTEFSNTHTVATGNRSSAQTQENVAGMGRDPNSLTITDEDDPNTVQHTSGNIYSDETTAPNLKGEVPESVASNPTIGVPNVDDVENEQNVSIADLSNEEFDSFMESTRSWVDANVPPSELDAANYQQQADLAEAIVDSVKDLSYEDLSVVYGLGPEMFGGIDPEDVDDQVSHLAPNINGYEDATRNEDPDVTVNGWSLAQQVQASVTLQNLKNGTNYGVEITSAKGPHGSSRHRDQHDTTQGIKGCECAVDFQVVDENGDPIAVNAASRGLYEAIAKDLVGRTGGSIGLGPAYSSAAHFDVANHIAPEAQYGQPGWQEWGEYGNDLAEEFAALRGGITDVNVSHPNDDEAQITIGNYSNENNPAISIGVPQDPEDDDTVAGMDNDPAPEAPETETETTRAGIVTRAGNVAQRTVGRTVDQVRSILGGIADMFGFDFGGGTPPDTDGEGESSTSTPFSLDALPQTALAIASAEADANAGHTVFSSLNDAIRSFFGWLFGNEEAKVYAELASQEEQAASRAYIQVLVRIDEATGAVQLSRTYVEGGITESEESSEDHPSLLIDAEGNIIYSDGKFAPPTDLTLAETFNGIEYVYLVERTRNGEVISAETHRGSLPGNIFTNTLARIFSDNSAFTLTDVEGVTYTYIDPDPNAIGDEYKDYTIALKDGSTRNVALPVETSLAFYTSRLAGIGYNGDAFALTNLGAETARRVGESQESGGLIGSIVGLFTSDSETSEEYTDLANFEIDMERTQEVGPTYAENDILSVLVYLEVPIACPGFAEPMLGSVYEIIVSLPNEQKDGVIGGVMCGTGTAEMYAQEITNNLIEQNYFTNLDSDTIFENLLFRPYETSGDADIPEDQIIPNETNTITFEAKVTRGGTTVTDWTADNVTLQAGEQLHLRWNAAAYARCLPFIADNGAYSLGRGGDLAMRTGNTETEGYDVSEQSGTYRIECDGQSNGEEGVDERRIEVEVR